MDPSVSLDDMLEEVVQTEFPDTEPETSVGSRVEELESGSDDEEATASSAPEVPNDFAKLATGFVTDVAAAFPEYYLIIKKWWGFESFTTPQVTNLFAHCMNVYPPRFTDIIYQNDDIFSSESTVNVDFLPGISFKFLWNCDNVTDVHRTTIWKYLQMVLLSVLGTLKTDTMSEDMKSIFDTMSEDNIKNKLQDTIENIQSVFDAAKNTAPDSETPEAADTPEGSATPDARTTAEGMQAQIDGLMGGKLGELAQEIAEETAQGLDMGEFDGSENVTDVFKKMFDNPGKFMNLVTNVTNKLDSKMKSGEFQQQDLMQEATGILQNMKDIPGMGNIQEMMGNLGGGGEGGAQPDMAGMANMVSSMMGGGEGGGGGVANIAEMMGGLMGGLKPGQKLDTNAMERNEKRTNKITQMKQRIEKKKLKEMIAIQQLQSDTVAREQAAIDAPPLTNDELIDLFNDSGVPLPTSGTQPKGSKNKKSKAKK
jgi:hypothetical protein